MLAAIIQNLQNGPQPQPKPRLPTVQIDRGGGGALWPRYQIIGDYIQAANSFKEMPNEHPVDRAARRTEHIGRELGRIQERREAEQKAMAVGMLWGAALERQTTTATLAELETTLATMRATPPPVPAVPALVERGCASHESGGGTAIAVLLLGVGAITAIAIAKSRSRRR